MIRINRQHQFHVSNRLAMLAAAILAFTAYFSLAHGETVARDMAGSAQSLDQPSSDNQSAGDSSAERRRFSVSLLLFKNG